MKERSFIRTVYLYLFSLVGLSLVIVGVVRLLDITLKEFVFTEANKEESFYYPTISNRSPEELKDLIEEDRELTSEEITQVKAVIEDYRYWTSIYNPEKSAKSRRHKDISNTLATILVGLPLYLYHWSLIKKDEAACFKDQA